MMQDDAAPTPTSHTTIQKFPEYMSYKEFIIPTTGNTGTWYKRESLPLTVSLAVKSLSIKSDTILACHLVIGADVFTTGHTGLSTLAALSEWLLVVLAPFTAPVGPVENCTRELNAALSS